jgi:hypothetical protein
LNFTDSKIILFSYILGSLCLIITSILIYRIAKILWNDYRIGQISALLFILHGPIIWGYLSGMDIFLVTTLMFLSILAYLKEMRPFFAQEVGTTTTKLKFPIKTVVFLSLLVLSRPEGFIMAILLFISLGLNIFFSKKKEVLSLVYLSIPLFVGILQLLTNYVLTGSIAFNTMRTKSVLYNPPKIYIFELIANTFSYFSYLLKEIFSGFSGKHIPVMNANRDEATLYFAPFSLLLFIIGILPQAFKELSSKRMGINCVLTLWFMVGLLAIASAVPYYYHWHRYSMPFCSIFIVGIALGIKRLSGFLAKDIKPHIVFYGISSFFVAFHLSTTLYFATAYGKNCKDIYFQQITLGKWVDKNLPLNAIIAINDIGALKYYGNRRIIDLCGLCTNKLSEAYANGSGSIYEFIENLPKDSYPDYFIIYPNWFAFEGISLLKEEIHEQRLLSVSIAGSGLPMKVYKADFSLAHSGDLPKLPQIVKELKGYRLVDKVDIADISSEKAHNYRFWLGEPSLYTARQHNEIKELSYFHDPNVKIIDGGRIINGGEKMQISNLIPGKDLKVVLRTRAVFAILVYVDGVLVGGFTPKHRVDDQWTDELFTIPGRFIKNSKINLKFKVGGGYGTAYCVYHWWFYQ